MIFTILFNSLFMLYFSLVFGSIIVNPIVDQIRSSQAKEPFYPKISDMTKCQLARSQPDLYNHTPTVTLGGFVGIGFDILHSLTKIAIFEETYRNCKMTPDNKFFLPDDYTVKVLAKAHLDRASEEFKSSSSYKSTLDVSVSASVTSEAVSASFSADISSSKESMNEKEKTMFLLKSTNEMYTMKGNKASKMTGAFESRIKDILRSLRNANERRAKRLVEETYRDFGTNVILEVTLGSMLYVKTLVDKSITMSDTKQSKDIKVSIDVNAEKVAVKASVNHFDNSSNYQNNSNFDSQMEVTAYGGPLLIKIPSQNRDDLMSVDHVVAIGRNHRPIYEIIHGGVLVALLMTDAEVQNMRMLFEAVYKEYIERNTYYGCTNREFANYDNQANVDDDTCGIKYCELKEINEHCRVHYFETNVKFTETNETKENDKTFLKLIKKNDNSTILTAIRNLKQNKHFEIEREIKYNIVKVDKSFFSKANETEFLECSKKGNFVPDGENFKNKVCGLTDSDWNNRKTGKGGMYQKCLEDKTSKKTIHELQKLGIFEPLPCNDINNHNIYTKSFKCPDDVPEILIVSYTTVLPDHIHTYWKEECDDENELGCFDVTIDFAIRHTVNITSFWCGKNQTTSVYFGGVFDRGQMNSYFRNEGCPFGTKAYRFFYDTTFCISENAVGFEKNAAELTRLFKAEDDPNYCTNQNSKQLITVVGKTRIYACIFKKAAYFDIPPATAVTLPFQQIGYSNDEYAESTVTVQFHNKSSETTLLSAFGYKITEFVENVTQTLKRELEEKMLQQKKMSRKSSVSDDQKGFFSPTIIIIIIFTTVLVFFGIFACTRR